MKQGEERLIELCIRSLYLFDHNVIVLPCKIGDTCYCVWSNPIGELFYTKETVGGFVYDEIIDDKVKIIPQAIKMISYFKLENAFLTEAEAENYKEKLEKMREEGENGKAD